MRVKRASRSAGADPAGNLLEVELLQEKAANLGRLARRLEDALEALRAHDDREPALTPEEQIRRRDLLTNAGEALFLYVVQREASGLNGTAAVLDELGVPREVRLRMAPRSVLLAR